MKTGEEYTTDKIKKEILENSIIKKMRAGNIILK